MGKKQDAAGYPLPTQAAHDRAEAHLAIHGALLRAADSHWNKEAATIIRAEAHRHYAMVRAYRARYGAYAQV